MQGQGQEELANSADPSGCRRTKMRRSGSREAGVGSPACGQWVRTVPPVALMVVRLDAARGRNGARWGRRAPPQLQIEHATNGDPTTTREPAWPKPPQIEPTDPAERARDNLLRPDRGPPPKSGELRVPESKGASDDEGRRRSAGR